MRLTFTRIRHLVLICLLLAIQVIIIAQDSPTRLTINEPVSGTLGDGNVTDIYEFEGTANGVLTITVTSEELSYGLLLKDAEGNTVSEAIADDDGVISLEDVLLTNTGSYLITIFSTGDEGDYEITILIEGSDTLAVEPEPSDPPASTGNFVTELPDVADVLVNSGMEVRLQWSAAVDLNLEVRDPRGNTLFFNNRQSSIGGSFGFDANGVCDVISDAPVETATWQPGFLPAGSYEILVFYRQNCTDSNLSVPFTVTVTYNGNVLEAIEGDIPPPINDNTDSVYVANFTVQDESTATVNQGGQYPDTALQNLPATTVELQGQAVPIERNVPITGALFEEQDFVVYSFEAEANENITVTMTATSRNLDTLLQLVGPNGNLLSVNDDSNGTTNST
ncbi:MAG: pre-peptidase C-terminal domain-containing protein, partial [Chloroflexota bacterium]